MKFVVSRTSVLPEVKPCEEAVRRQIPNVDRRIFQSPEAFDAQCAKREGPWLSVGKNHGVDKRGRITREVGVADVWMISLRSLNDLLAFIQKYGSVMIDECWVNPDYYEISIYDSPIE